MKNKVKVFLMVLLGVLCIGGTTTIFASDSEPRSITLSDGFMLKNIPSTSDKFLIIKQNNGYYLVYYDFDFVPDLADLSSSKCSFSCLYKTKDGLSFVQQGVNDFHYILAMGELIYSTDDIYCTDGSVFFRVPVDPIMSVQELPEKIIAQIKIILSIAIGGLALLIGSIVLLPKLKKFLVG